MCEYTSHGHCGILSDNDVNNDKTLEILGKIALSHARAGAHMVAPSDMMDGRIGHIRNVLDENGYENVAIMSYAAKYSSHFMAPLGKQLIRLLNLETEKLIKWIPPIQRRH